MNPTNKSTNVFEFKENIVQLIIDELKEAENFINIAVFQIHNKEIFNTLENKLNNGVKVDIFTLPYDSINDDIRNDVIPLFENLKNKGAILHFCKWNIGDPERTTTAIGRWYLFHGKFIVTDKSAMVLSANLMQEEELDAAIIFRDDMNKINEYNKKFHELIELFVKENNKENIKAKIGNSGLLNGEIIKLFELPKSIETNTHKNFWIHHYPVSIFSNKPNILEGLHITPFDYKGREVLKLLIDEAEKFIYISTESFTDPEFPEYLIRKSLNNNNIEIKLLSGASSMDFPDRIQKMILELLACNIKIKTYKNIHAKFIVTDKHIAISSINLNKINLGFAPYNNKFWRENTETIAIYNNNELLEEGKIKFNDNFDRFSDIKETLINKYKTIIKDKFSLFDLRTREDVKELFARLIIQKKIEIEEFILYITKITSKIIIYLNNNSRLVTKKYFILSLILYYLTERKYDIDQLNEKLSILKIDMGTINDSLKVLLDNDFIEKDNDFYKINLNKLFKY